MDCAVTQKKSLTITFQRDENGGTNEYRTIIGRIYRDQNETTIEETLEKVKNTANEALFAASTSNVRNVCKSIINNSPMAETLLAHDKENNKKVFLRSRAH